MLFLSSVELSCKEAAYYKGFCPKETARHQYMCNRNNCHFQPHHLDIYRVFHRFVQAKFAYGGQVLGSSRFLLLPQLPEKKLASKVVKIDSKIIISRHESKSVTHSEGGKLVRILSIAFFWLQKLHLFVWQWLRCTFILQRKCKIIGGKKIFVFVYFYCCVYAK